MVSYPTRIEQRHINGKLFVLEVIRDLDEAIDQLCAELGEDNGDPFAEDLCPYFGILWPAAEGLARYLEENKVEVANKSVIELGCGLGLPSMVAKNLGANVLATDFHPDVAFYLERNCRHSSLTVKYQRYNWRDPAEDVGKFDVVMGSDVLYESKHPGEVAAALIKLMKPGGEILLADPGRNYLKPFIAAMVGAGFNFDVESRRITVTEVTVYKFQKS